VTGLSFHSEAYYYCDLCTPLVGEKEKRYYHGSHFLLTFPSE